MRAAIAFAVIVLAMPAFAGTEMKFVCRHCGLKGTYGIGGGITFEEFSAYCTNKRHFVSISWDRNKRRPKPVRSDGGVALFRCPFCHTATARSWDQQQCPRCGSKRFKTKASGLIYD